MARAPMAEGSALSADTAADVAPALLEVEFIRRHEKYNAGERVNFPPATARNLVALGLAVRAGTLLDDGIRTRGAMSDPTAMIRK